MSSLIRVEVGLVLESAWKSRNMTRRPIASKTETSLSLTGTSKFQRLLELWKES